MKNKKDMLNLGCGHKIQTGPAWINHDLTLHSDGVDIAHDLNILQWPFDDDQFSTVHMIDVIEHLQHDAVVSLNELWRITRAGGLVYIKHPIHTSPAIHDDPTHRWFLSAVALDHVIQGTALEQHRPYYTPYKWRLIDSRLHKNLSRHLKITPIK